MTDRLDGLYQHVDAHANEYVELLRDFVRRPSRTGVLDEVGDFAQYLVGILVDRGWTARAVKVDDGAPIVHGQLAPPPGGKRLLLYSHYDVISPEPVASWTHPPFDAVQLEDGTIVGRGTSDAKANLLALILSIETLREVGGGLAFGVDLIVDGEEERGSVNLPAFLDAFRDHLGVDAVLSFDGSIDASRVPKIGLGTSGMVFVELVCRGSSQEMHSSAARLYPNPAWRLTWALASLKDQDEHVLIDGFADDIRTPTEAEAELMDRMQWDDEAWLAAGQVSEFLTGVRGRAAVERLLFQPGLAICGLTSGYPGEGPKAAIPTSAACKLEFRIVENQTPERVLALLREHLDQRGFDDVAIDVLATVETAHTDPDTAIVDAAVAAARSLYGEPILKPTEEYAGRQGAWLGRALSAPGVQTGIGSPDARAHAADEFVVASDYIHGIKYAATIFAEYVERAS